jgi:GDP-L-fucose synthase
MSEYFSGKKILVTGGKGFLGSHVVHKLKEAGCNSIVTFSSREYDLKDIYQIRSLLDLHRPDIIIHAAAKVGGIGANVEKPAEFFYDNLIMGLQLMDEARKSNVLKFVTIGTVCMYPKHTPIPFKEEEIWNGYPAEDTAPYGLAKKMLMVQGQVYKRQYGYNSIFLIPANLYGPGDNFNPESSHVIPALIKKFVDAVDEKRDEVEIWGSGKATREFIYVEDAALAIVKATEAYNETDPVNIGTGEEVSIKDLAEKIAELTGYEGNIVWNKSKPDGQPRRCIDVSKAKERFGFKVYTSLEDGLGKTISWYKNNN